MINLFRDDCRKRPEGFTWARSTEECLLLLRECKVQLLSLDLSRFLEVAPEVGRR